MFEQEIQQLSDELAASLPSILAKASHILGRQVDFNSLNGILGGKGRTHAKVWERKFSCFEEYFACWLEAMYKDYLSRKDEMEGAGFRNAMLLRDPDIMAFAEKYLRRTFYRKHDERFSGNAATQAKVNSLSNKIDALKRQFYSI